MSSVTDNTIRAAADAIRSGEADCVLLYADGSQRRGSGRGVRPLLQLTNEEPDALRGAVLVDKVIGKAAAMLAALGGVAAVHALTASEAGLAYLAARGIPAEAEAAVPHILNRTGDDLCPLEKCVQPLDDPQQGLAAIRETVAQLMAQKN